ncbi:MlaA family lipoprotein [Flavisphingomonas formosensis]|uniref:MlaA family lipoprotein n=1 Tax=Flavisphingomonas formosensis TaxID=861534 RepID=UPI001E56A13A|nr:VacJ family lipoprotein [Sphingomonas formosensis]
MSIAALASTLSLLNAAPGASDVPAVLATPPLELVAAVDATAPPPPVDAAASATSAPADAAPDAAVPDGMAADAAADAVAGNPHPPHTKGDPLEGFNRAMFSVNQSLDKAIFRPAAMGYKHVVPKPARSGLRNMFTNLSEPVVFVNDLLQLKPKRAVKTLFRTILNTIFGIGGLIDVAKREGLPHRDNGFGNTLAFYGVKSGPYLFLPLMGPSTLRDFGAGQFDAAVLPLAVGRPFDRLEYQLPKAVITGLDARAEADTELKALFSTALDPYATLRSVYLQNRASEIAGLKKKAGEQDIPLDDPLEDPAAATQPPAGQTQP